MGSSTKSKLFYNRLVKRNIYKVNDIGPVISSLIGIFSRILQFHCYFLIKLRFIGISQISIKFLLKASQNIFFTILVS